MHIQGSIFVVAASMGCTIYTLDDLALYSLLMLIPAMLLFLMRADISFRHIQSCKNPWKHIGPLIIMCRILLAHGSGNCDSGMCMHVLELLLFFCGINNQLVTMCHRIAMWGFHNWGYPPNHPLSKWIFLNHPAIGLSRTPIATPPVIIVSGSLPRKHLFEQLEACGGGLRSFPDTVRK